MNISKIRCCGVLIVLLLSSVRTRAADMMPMEHEVPAVTPVKAAVALLIPTVGNKVFGTVRFTQMEGGVRVVADVSGLKQGVHGFHIHEFGDITSADGMSTGGHLNPSHAKHGAPDAVERHEGDLGNLTADANGHATLDYVDTVITLNGPTSIIGHGVVVHADADDLKSQPVGNAGKRVATGVIGVAKN